MGIPTRGETFSKLLEHLRQAQEDCAMLAHLHNTEGSDKDKQLARAWLILSELMKKAQHNVTELAKGNLQ